MNQTADYLPSDLFMEIAMVAGDAERVLGGSGSTGEHSMRIPASRETLLSCAFFIFKVMIPWEQSHLELRES